MHGLIRLCLAALICLAAWPAVSAERVDMAAVMTAFDEMILRGQGRVAKWPERTAPLTFKVAADFGEREAAALASAIAAIETHTKLRFRRDQTAVRPAILIEMSDDLGTPFAGAHNVGWTRSSFERVSGEVTGAHIRILRDWSRGDARRIDRTMPHEMLHAVGFHGHAQSFESVMSMRGTGYGLTKWDILFLKVLYDPRLPIGTPRVFALPLACRLIHDRLIAEANREVSDLNRTGPHRYCEDLARQPVAATASLDQVMLAWAYLKGLGVARDIAQAELWARRAQAQNDSDAAYVLYQIDPAKAPKR
jgi:hypothetical protein